VTDLITVVDLEAALGRELTEDEEGKADYIVSLISSYIQTYTGLSFELQTTTIRMKSDYYGAVQLPGGNIQEILEVNYYYGAEAVYYWDGIDMIFGLEPAQAVDVRYSYGYTEVPDEIVKVATQAAKRLLLTPDGAEPGSLFKYRVGDVEEMYSGAFGSLGRGMFNDLEKLILDQYRITATTMRTGFTFPDVPINKFPESDSALFE